LTPTLRIVVGGGSTAERYMLDQALIWPQKIARFLIQPTHYKNERQKNTCRQLPNNVPAFICATVRCCSRWLIELPVIPDDWKTYYHMFYLVM